MFFSVRSRAPVRISFAGGGTDVSPYPEEKGGCVLSSTIDKYSFTTLKWNKKSNVIRLDSTHSDEVFLESIERAVFDGKYDLAKAVLLEIKPTQGLELFFRNDVPPKSGLGSSAAGFVSLLGAFNIALKQKLSIHEIAEMAFKLEREYLKVKGGKQDQFASAYGGINFIEFKKNETKVYPLKLKKEAIFELEKNLVMVYAADRNNRGQDVLKDQIKSVQTHKKQVMTALDESKQLAVEMKKALQKQKLNEFGELLHAGWMAKKKYSKFISTPFIDKLYTKARQAGALGGKITGAGGGGHMIFYCKPDTEIKVRKQLELMGAIPVPFAFEFQGLQTWNIGD
ncbi:MAG: GHMP kinase [Candidatus Diapherotrites archaeon]|nr:GHMP kinase [Candidatus Diapherotrites archaeon]